MQEILAQLTRVRGIGGCLLVSADGLPMASSLRSGTDENTLSATIGELLGAAGRLTQHLGLGGTVSFNAVGDQGGLLLVSTGPAFIVLLIDAGANLALLQIEAKPLIERLAARLAL
jgi:predicted regulator of Ras-like GTPase activity (Roadblock/LC7/MglB family)